MATLRIHSRLRHFNLLTRILRVSMAEISGTADFEGMPPYCALEAMAQLAALHVRHCADFRCHAFLLKVGRYQWPTMEVLQGRYRLTAECVSQGSHAFAYRVKALGLECAGLEAELLIGTQSYDDGFREEILQAHYRDLFNRLQP
jgi:hypothetical protein